MHFVLHLLIGDHPRVCGEHFQHYDVPLEPEGSSPRMRGTLNSYDVAKSHHGIIPAYAGNTWRFRVLAQSLGDHPRVCGEHRPGLSA